MRPGEIAQGQRVGSDVQADRFHRADAAQRAHLRAVEHRRAQRFVVGDARPDALRLIQRRDQLHRVKKARDGRTGVACQEMGAAFCFERALDQQFVPGKDLGPLLLEESWIDCHDFVVARRTLP